MRVIFVEDIGRYKAGEVAEIKDGYARNFLIPQKKAVPATSKNIAHLKDKLEEAKHRHEELLKLLNETKEKLEKENLVFERKTEQADKLFGTVTAMDVWEHLAEAGYQVEKHDIEVDDISKLGSHKARVDLGEGVTAEVTIEVKAENG